MIARVSVMLPALTMITLTSAEAQRDSLTLQQALNLAREHSPALTAAMAEVRAMDGRRQAVRALYGPQVSGGALYLRFQDPPAMALGPAGSFSPLALNGYFVQLGVQQPLYTGGRISAAVSAAEWGGHAASAAHEQAEVELTAAVAHAFDAALLAEALLGVAEDGVQVLRSAASVAEEQHAAGAVARLDVLRAETRLAAAEQEARAAVEAILVARERLAVLIGIDPTAAPTVSGTLERAYITRDAAAFAARSARALQRRPDLRALGAGAEVAHAQARIARANLRPTVSLYVAGLGTRPELLTGREGWNTDLLGGLMVSWPIFDFGRAAGEGVAARSEAERFEAEARQVADAAAAQVSTALRNLERAELDIAAGRENVGRAERALEIAQDRYAEGIGLQLEVLEAESDLSRTRAALLRAIHDHRSAAIEIRRGIGLAADAALPIQSEGR